MIRSLLGRVTMYRLVTIVLTLLVVVALVLAATSRISPEIFTLRAMFLTLVVLLLSSVVVDHVFGAMVGRRPHVESAFITGLLLWFLYWPSSETPTLAWFALIAGIAQASKYVLAWRGRHLFNPAAAGVAATVLIGEILGERAASPPPRTTWWVATEVLFPFVLVGAALVLLRTGRRSLALSFVVPAALLTAWGYTAFDPDVWATAEYVVYSTPIVFFAGFMLSEPLTMAPRRAQQWALGVLAAVVFSWPLFSQRFLDEPLALGPFEGTYELALLAVNLIAFFLGQRGGITLRLAESRRVAGDVHEFRFAPRRPLRMLPGQYLELQVSHIADMRGVRRVFTVVSAPGDETVAVAARVPEDCSSFKRALLDLEPGDEAYATGVQGDFVWPRGDAPLLLVAGGIGVTPFVSQLRAQPDRDAVLVYGVASSFEVAYRDELVELGVPVVLVSPGEPDDLPDGWTHVAADQLTADLVCEQVPDHAARKAFVSGPPDMVTVLASGLRRHGLRVRTDHFTGY
ncbi:MAG: hypothetical protein QM621_11015 [Aeromicrobium sp.]|uniref:hypothetical protein n=1 Tax=Aeromicrobium sp. TaxID=1871063 RepID=UPI0039E6E891